MASRSPISRTRLVRTAVFRSPRPSAGRSWSAPRTQHGNLHLVRFSNRLEVGRDNRAEAADGSEWPRSGIARAGLCITAGTHSASCSLPRFDRQSVAEVIVENDLETLEQAHPPM